MKTIFVGPFGGGKIPTNGASVKNYHILSKLNPLLGDSLIAIDTELWKKSPKVLISLLITILSNSKAKYILSLNNASSIRIIRILKWLAPKAKVIDWVIGGTIAKWAIEGRFDPRLLKSLERIVVEGDSMRRDLESLGFTNVSVMPNFKKIVNVDSAVQKKSRKTEFVFLSRIIPEKGVLTIFDAVSDLCKNGYSDKFEVDFYGPIDDSFKDRFMSSIQNFDNARYKGFLDLRNPSNYNELAKYDAMLFPTFWDGEGCPGIVIDAFMVGLPIIASDWSLNRDYIADGKTGIIIPPKDSDALRLAMQSFIENNDLKIIMTYHINNMSKKFDIDQVLSVENLQRLNIV